MTHQIYSIPGAHTSRFARVGKKLHFSGLVAFDAQGGTVGVGDFEVQARRIFAILKQALAEQGGSLRNVLNLRVYLTHQSNMAAYRALRLELFPEGAPPDIVLIVSSLAEPDKLIEVDPVAVLD